MKRILGLLAFISLVCWLNFEAHVSQTTEPQDAPQATAYGENIFDLLEDKNKTVEVIGEGNGMDSVSVRVRRVVPYTVAVLILVGTFFDASNSSAQSMVATGESSITLNDDEWHEMDMPAACANRSKEVPHGGDTFTIERAPRQAELAKLVPLLDRAYAEYPVRQAAVWIVTDNADYDDLGKLVDGNVYGMRVIHETDAARAMQIVEQAGIPISEKRFGAIANE